MFINDSRRPRGIGILPLQHEDHFNQGIDIDMRTGIIACRIKERLTDIEHVGRYWYDPKTVGDLNGGMFWPESTRPIGSWQFAFPAQITTGGTSSGGTPTPGGDGKMPQGPMIPMRDEMKVAKEFGKLSPVIPKFKDGSPMWPKFPKGHVGLGMKGINTEKQHDYFQPTDPRMVAASQHGEPEFSSMMFDLTPGNEYDPERMVRLHDFFRICKKPTGGFLFPDRNICAWNIFNSNIDTIRGGWVYDFADGGNVIAGVSQNVSGPFDVGDAGDQHRLGADADGHPINSLHLSTNSYFRGPAYYGIGDAPLFFETGPYPDPPTRPNYARVHLVLDRTAQHPFVLGPRQGLWKWYAETTTYTVTSYKPPQPPPPPPQPPLTPVPTGGGTTGGGTTGPLIGEPVPTVDTKGVPEGSTGTGGTPSSTPTGVTNSPTTTGSDTIGPDGLTQREFLDRLYDSTLPESTPVPAVPLDGPAVNPPGPQEGKLFLRDPATGEKKSNPEDWDPWAPQDFEKYKTKIIGPMSPGADFSGAFVGTNFNFSVPGLNFRPQDMTPGSPDFRYDGTSGLLGDLSNALLAGGSSPANLSGLDQVARRKAERQTPVVGSMASFGQQGGQTGVSAGKVPSPTNTGASGDPWTYNDFPGTGRTSGVFPGGTARGGIIFMSPEVDIMDMDNDFAPSGVTKSEFYVMTAPGAYFGAGSVRTSTARPKLGYRWGIDASNDLLFERTDTWGVPTGTFKATDDGLLQFVLGDSTSYGNVCGKIEVALTSASTTGTGSEENLMATTTPAYTLNALGKGIRVRVWGKTAANANAKTLKVYIGIGGPPLSTQVITNDITGSPNALDWEAEVLIFRTSASNQKYVAKMTVGSVEQTMQCGTLTITDTTTIFAFLYGQAAANDITAHGMYLEAIT